MTNGGPADWFYAQHAPIFLTPNSTGVFQLGLFDNGNSRILNANGAKCGDSGQPTCYSTVPIFEIDEANRTAKVVWRDKLEFFSNAVGNMQVLDNGDVWFDAGRVSDDQAIIREVTMRRHAADGTGDASQPYCLSRDSPAGFGARIALEITRCSFEREPAVSRFSSVS